MPTIPQDGDSTGSEQAGAGAAAASDFQVVSVTGVKHFREGVGEGGITFTRFPVENKIKRLISKCSQLL